MRLGRLMLVVATLVAILVFPLVARDALQAVRAPDAHAQAVGGLDPAGTVSLDDNDNNNDGSADNDNNDESDNEGEDNDNEVKCYRNLNSNEEVPCDFDDNGNGNDGGRVRRRAEARGESVNRPTKCFDTREVGVVQLGTGSYDVTVQVMPHSSFGQTTRLTLRRLDPASVQAVSGGTLVDSVVYQLDAQSSCDGAAIGQLPNNVNMGIVYNVTGAVDKSKLQIVMLRNNVWQEVPTVPDPVNPYISATIQETGIYAVIQKP